MERRLAAILAADVVGYSRLMGQDEAGTLQALKALRAEVIDPTIGEHKGRIFKTTGDGVLVEFPSVVSAAACAVEIQAAMLQRGAAFPSNSVVALRIGVHVGDVIVEGDDVFGDGVNIAARLESIASPNAVAVSGVVREHLGNRLDLNFEDAGEHRLKNIAQPVRVYQISVGTEKVACRPSVPAPSQTVKFCVASDGTNIAYATVGNGYPLVMGASWLTHLEYDWESPANRHYLSLLSQDHKLLRYDPRGSGLSDWNVADISFDAFVSDMAAVLNAAGLEVFPVFAMSQAASVSLAYTARHPQRVSKLILCGGYARGRRKRGNPREIAESEALITLIEKGWASDNPAYRQMLTSIFLPNATEEDISQFNHLQKISTNAANAARFRRVFDDFDVTDLLDQISVPTLVLHCRNDAAVPLQEARILASRIPGARFVSLESNNHFLLEPEPAWPEFVKEVKAFLAE